MSEHPKSAKTRPSSRIGAKPEPRPSAAATGEDAPAPLIRIPIAVRWRDLDALNHVNNASFLTYVEEARLIWFASLPDPWIDENISPLLAAAHVNFRRPIQWPARIAVELFVERLGTTSLTLGHRIVAEDDPQTVYADGHSVLVWIDRRGGRPTALPESVRAACGG